MRADSLAAPADSLSLSLRCLELVWEAACNAKEATSQVFIDCQAACRQAERLCETAKDEDPADMEQSEALTEVIHLSRGVLVLAMAVIEVDRNLEMLVSDSRRQTVEDHERTFRQVLEELVVIRRRSSDLELEFQARALTNSAFSDRFSRVIHQLTKFMVRFDSLKNSMERNFVDMLYTRLRDVFQVLPSGTKGCIGRIAVKECNDMESLLHTARSLGVIEVFEQQFVERLKTNIIIPFFHSARDSIRSFASHGGEYRYYRPQVETIAMKESRFSNKGPRLYRYAFDLKLAMDSPDPTREWTITVEDTDQSLNEPGIEIHPQRMNFVSPFKTEMIRLKRSLKQEVFATGRYLTARDVAAAARVSAILAEDPTGHARNSRTAAGRSSCEDSSEEYNRRKDIGGGDNGKEAFTKGPRYSRLLVPTEETLPVPNHYKKLLLVPILRLVHFMRERVILPHNLQVGEGLYRAIMEGCTTLKEGLQDVSQPLWRLAVRVPTEVHLALVNTAVEAMLVKGAPIHPPLEQMLRSSRTVSMEKLRQTMMLSVSRTLRAARGRPEISLMSSQTVSHSNSVRQTGTVLQAVNLYLRYDSNESNTDSAFTSPLLLPPAMSSGKRAFESSPIVEDPKAKNRSALFSAYAEIARALPTKESPVRVPSFADGDNQDGMMDPWESTEAWWEARKLPFNQQQIPDEISIAAYLQSETVELETMRAPTAVFEVLTGILELLNLSRVASQYKLASKDYVNAATEMVNHLNFHANVPPVRDASPSNFLIENVPMNWGSSLVVCATIVSWVVDPGWWVVPGKSRGDDAATERLFAALNYYSEACSLNLLRSKAAVVAAIERDVDSAVAALQVPEGDEETDKEENLELLTENFAGSAISVPQTVYHLLRSWAQWLPPVVLLQLESGLKDHAAAVFLEQFGMWLRHRMGVYGSPWRRVIPRIREVVIVYDELLSQDVIENVKTPERVRLPREKLLNQVCDFLTRRTHADNPAWMDQERIAINIEKRIFDVLEAAGEVSENEALTIASFQVLHSQ